MRVCLSVFASAKISPSTWLITHSAGKPKATFVAQVVAPLQSLLPPGQGPLLLHAFQHSMWVSAAVCVLVCVCLSVNACGWHNNKMLVFYISI